MNKEDFDNDEPIHHFEGKTILRSCPSVLTSAQSGESSPLITISPPVTISPPDLQQDLEQDISRIQLILNISINLIVEDSVVNFYHDNY